MGGSDDVLAPARRELAQVPPAGFVARRKELSAQAREGGDRELASAIAALRKPTTSAWAVNLLVANHRELVDRLIALGGDLRGTQVIDPALLGAFRERRAEILRELISCARSGCAERGIRLSPSLVGEVEQTLGAVLADADAAAMVLCGHLEGPLQYTGLSTGTVTRPTRTSPGTPIESRPRVPRTAGGRSELADAARRRAVAAAAQADLDRAIADLAVADRERDEANRVLSAAELRVAAAERELAAATEAEHRAEGGFAEANDKHDRAVAAVRLAQATLDGLTRRR